MRKFFKSFSYAAAGVLHTMKVERNFKVHLLVAFLVLVMGILVELSIVQWFIIIILIGVVLALELVNTALERIVDLVTEEYHPLAKQAKDAAAGAVLVFAIASAVIGLLIFMPKWLLIFG